MKFNAVIQHKFFKPACGAGLAVLCGLLLWGTALGDAWENASYDYLFLFAPPTLPETNKVVLVLMDDLAYRELGQKRGQLWDRKRHTDLLNKLADDDCPMVVFDVFFEQSGDAEADKALAEAMRRKGNVILAAKYLPEETPKYTVTQAGIYSLFNVAALAWGYADAGVNELHTPRWEPFVVPGGSRSLPKIAAQVAGTRITETRQERWLRYYGENGGWKHCSYHQALSQPPDYFHNKIVFIGTEPERKNNPDYQDKDKFHTPYTRWTDKAVGGVEIMATTFLNLMNGDWLRRPAGWVEALLLVVTGVLLGGGLCQVRPLMACGLAIVVALAVTLGAVSLSYFTNFWFPWLVIVGGQVPCALAWRLVSTRIRAVKTGPSGTIVVLTEKKQPATPLDFPEVPDYERFHLLGKGAFGEVWLVRSAIGQWQALKVVYRANFEDDRPYDMEFEGIEKFKPVSEKHPGLLRTEFVSRKRPEGYFYYVMELGDAQVSGWETNPATYQAWTLASLCKQASANRLALRDCLRIGIALAEALEFLHQNGLTHRDIKPANVIFVNGLPKLADVGLVTGARRPDQEATRVGTIGFMPPEPEPQGTVQADVYALGMLLYVISTGRQPARFPDLSTTLLERTGEADFMRLNPIIMKACQPDCANRYASAAELQRALQGAHDALEANSAT